LGIARTGTGADGFVRPLVGGSAVRADSQALHDVRLVPEADPELGSKAQGPLSATSRRREEQSCPRGSNALRLRLIAVDVVAVLLSSIADMWIRRKLGGQSAADLSNPLLVTLTTTVAAVGLIASQRLYLARVCSTRAIEIERLFRVAVLYGLVGAGIIWVSGYRPSITGTLSRSILAFVFLALGRSLYRAWLTSQRRRGRYGRPVLIVGADDDAAAWSRLLNDHPELGLRVSGIVSDTRPFSLPEVPWLGSVAELRDIARSTGATGAMVAATAFSPPALNGIIRDLLAEKVHVQISNGLRGIAPKRLTPTCVARESLLYVERNSLSEWQLHVKRAIDVIVSSLALIVMAPVLVLAAVAIKLCDRGPVLFKQQRVGQNGQLFTVYKLRTMVVDAENLLPDIMSINQRGGPLFKVTRDPRITPVGRFLRASSLDEVPQFVNVLHGHMSVVGPRPALPSEVEQFGDELLGRHDVKPGITGLWQLEARDNPSFDSYQRLDLHYIENWSILLDMAIMMSTTGSVIARTGRTLAGQVRARFRDNRIPEPLVDA
jgi:exopolysaccharide biosynthesis polyprenyl glycosylphosphotransferase